MNKLPRMNVINKQAAAAIEGSVTPDQLDAVQGGQGNQGLPQFLPPGGFAPMYGAPIFDERFKQLLESRTPYQVLPGSTPENK